MNPIKLYILALALLCVFAVNLGCSNEKVLEISANPTQISGQGLVDVTWRTKGYENTVLTSNPLVTGLPKTVTGNVGPVTDKFTVNKTTTFQITATIQGQNGPFVNTKSVTVTVPNTIK